MTRIASRSGGSWLWPIVIAALMALLVVWLFTPSAVAPVSEPAGANGPGDEWTTAPEGPAAPVALPDAPMRNVRGETDAAQTSAPADDRERPR